MDTAAIGNPWRSVWFWLGLTAAAGCAGFLVFSPTFHEWVEALTEWAEGVMRTRPVAGSAVF